MSLTIFKQVLNGNINVTVDDLSPHRSIEMHGYKIDCVFINMSETYAKNFLLKNHNGWA